MIFDIFFMKLMVPITLMLFFGNILNSLKVRAKRNNYYYSFIKKSRSHSFHLLGLMNFTLEYLFMLKEFSSNTTKRAQKFSLLFCYTKLSFSARNVVISALLYMMSRLKIVGKIHSLNRERCKFLLISDNFEVPCLSIYRVEIIFF